ncbi:MAG: two-component regulator propeller domain-containing protein, partial [Bacteroidota bacterium]
MKSRNHRSVRGALLAMTFLLIWAIGLPAQQYNFDNYSVPDGLGQAQVMSICQDSRGFVWFATYGGGASRFDGTSFRNFTTDDGLADNIVNDVMEDEDGNLWFSHFGKGVCRYDGRTFECFGEQDGLFVEGKILLLDGGGGKIWALTENNGAYMREQGKWRHFEQGDGGLPSDSVLVGVRDANNVIWLGTGNGLCRYDGRFFQTWKNYNDAETHTVQALTINNEGLLYLAHAGGISTFDGKRFQQLEGSEVLVDEGIRKLFSDSRNRLWIATERGLRRWDSGRYLFYREHEDLWDNRINCMFEDREGIVWIGTNGDGVSRFQSEMFQHYRGVFAENVVFGINQRPDGSYWIGTAGGIFVLQNGQIQPLKGNPIVENDYIMDFTTDGKGNTWISTFKGLLKYDGSNFRLMPLPRKTASGNEPITVST